MEERARGAHRSVLLIEADCSVASLVMSALRAEGYHVIGSVAGLDEALRVAAEEEPDLVLLRGRMIPLREFRSGSR